MPFDWDPAKAASNLLKHDVEFEEAQTIFLDWRIREENDEFHSVYEDRVIATGRSAGGRLLTVIYAIRGENIRIISARLAAAHERRAYERRI